MDTHDCMLSPADVAGVIEQLEEMHDTVQALLNGRSFFLLLEKQYLDKDSRLKPTAIQQPTGDDMCSLGYHEANMYCSRSIEPSLRYSFLGLVVVPSPYLQKNGKYPFLGIHGWKKMTRHFRKKAVVEEELRRAG